MFSGFFFAKSVSEGGYLYGIWQISDGSKKIRRFLKKLAIFLKKNKVFFYLTCCFWGSRISHMYVPLYTYVRAADTCFVLYDILSSFRIYFHFFIVSLRRKSVI